MSDAAKKVEECNRFVRDENNQQTYCLRPATYRTWTGARWLYLCTRCADLVRQSTYGKKEVTKIP